MRDTGRDKNTTNGPADVRAGRDRSPQKLARDTDIARASPEPACDAGDDRKPRWGLKTGIRDAVSLFLPTELAAPEGGDVGDWRLETGASASVAVVPAAGAAASGSSPSADGSSDHRLRRRILAADPNPSAAVDAAAAVDVVSLLPYARGARCITNADAADASRFVDALADDATEAACDGPPSPPPAAAVRRRLKDGLAHNRCARTEARQRRRTQTQQGERDSHRVHAALSVPGHAEHDSV